MPSTPTPPAASAVRASEQRPSPLAGELRISIGRMNRQIKARRGDADLPDPQFSVLVVLSKNGPLSPGAIADHEHVQPPSMTRTVNALAELGLVAKTEHPTDGRQVVVTLTPAGEAEVRETRRRRDTWLAQRLTSLTPEERSTLAEASQLLRRIAAG